MNLPPPRVGGSHEQAGRRPALIIPDEQSVQSLPTTIVIPGTTNLGATRYPFTVQVDPSDVNGLSAPTVFMCFQLRVVDKRIIEAPPLGSLEIHYFEDILAKLRQVLGL